MGVAYSYLFSSFLLSKPLSYWPATKLSVRAGKKRKKKRRDEREVGGEMNADGLRPIAAFAICGLHDLDLNEHAHVNRSLPRTRCQPKRVAAPSSYSLAVYMYLCSGFCDGCESVQGCEREDRHQVVRRQFRFPASSVFLQHWNILRSARAHSLPCSCPIVWIQIRPPKAAAHNQNSRQTSRKD